MQYPLAPLLRIRELREREAASRLATVRQEVEQAQRDLEQARQDLEDYVRWRLEKETELYAEITGAMLSVRELENFRQNLTALREKDHEYQTRIHEAREHLEQMNRNLEQQRQAHSKALAGKRKIEEHSDIWCKQAAALALAKEENELEELGGHTMEEDEDGDECA